MNNREMSASRAAYMILWVVISLAVFLLIWAKFAVLDEVTHGEGKVIPSSQIQVIQNLEGGIVKKVLVKEGEIVQKGQVLIQIDDVRFASSYQEGLKKQLGLQIKLDRLTAEINNVPFTVPPELEKQAPDLVNYEKVLYTSRESQMTQMHRGLDLATKELNMTRPLVAKGAASEVEIIRLERQTSDMQGQIDAAESKVLQELNDTRSELLALTESNKGLQDRVTRTVIHSPVRGIVKQIKVTTEGGISQPGADLMEIVPLDDTLLIEAKIKPRDIGFIYPHQRAIVKITAYDSAIYGGLDAQVEQISADTITNEKDESFYLVRVRTDKNYLGTKQKPLYIMPGMMATVDIITGRKSVLHYLLKPIIKARENALRER